MVEKQLFGEALDLPGDAFRSSKIDGNTNNYNTDNQKKLSFFEIIFVIYKNVIVLHYITHSVQKDLITFIFQEYWGWGLPTYQRQVKMRQSSTTCSRRV